MMTDQDLPSTLPSADEMSSDRQKFVFAIKQMMGSFTPYLMETGSVQVAEDALRHLEEEDPHFHRHALVKHLRTSIESSLGIAIDDELESHHVTGHSSVIGQEAIVNHIVEKIVKSQNYKNMMGDLKSQISTASDYLHQNFAKEFKDMESMTSFNQSNESKRMDHIFSDGESSLGESSLNQSRFMFMNNEQFHQLGDAVNKNKPIHVRRDALKSLIQIPITDVQNSEPAWVLIRQGVLDALGEEEQTLWALALKFISRAFSSNSNYTKDIYSMLIEFLRAQFSISNKNMHKFKDGLDASRPEHIKLLKVYRLMNEFQCQINQYWIRYTDKFVEEILEGTVSLLSLQHSTKVTAQTQISPVHLLSLIDPTAKWFKHWMHGQYSRGPLLRILGRHKNIVESAVNVCLGFTQSKGISLDLSDAVDLAGAESETGRRMFYSGNEIEYTHFVHSLHLVSGLLCYKEGRSMFPIKLKEKDDELSLTSFIVMLVKLLTASPSIVSSRSPAVQLNPGILITEAFRKISSSEESCRSCLCNDSVTNTLLSPLKYRMDKTKNHGNLVGESAMLQIAEVFSMMGACNHGRSHLLYGETNQKFIRQKSAPIHVIAEFSRRGLTGTLTGSAVSKAVIGNFVYVCRQLYSTCEGLFVLSSYDLHSVLATSWNVACRESDNAATPTPSVDGAEIDLNRESQYLVLWEDSLRDNLLSFAGTPKGLMMLVQTNTINDCVSYLYSRREQHLQVSKYEKYGYGYLLSQISATKIGIEALQNTGYIKLLIQHLWGILEVVDDRPAFTPQRWSVDVIDKNAMKCFINLVQLLSFPAISLLLPSYKLPNKKEYSFRELPSSLYEMFDRVVFVNSEAKIHSLFNYEQSHLFGLRLLSVLTSCLNTHLLLQAQFKYQDILLSCQDENRMPDSGAIVLDALTVERNCILVKTYVIGGPNERLPIGRDIPMKEDQIYPFPLFSNYPVPKEYLMNYAKPNGKQENDLSRFLHDSKKIDLSPSWKDKCRKLFTSVLLSNPDHLCGALLIDLLERGCSALKADEEQATMLQSEALVSEGMIKNIKLSAIQHEGIQLSVRYGLHLKIISSQSEGTGKLSYLIKYAMIFLQAQQRKVQDTGIQSTFDWFTATVFLAMSGNVEKSIQFLQQFSTLAVSAFLWPARIENSIFLPLWMSNNDVHPITLSACHNMELVLQGEVPHVHSAFRMSGFSPTQIWQQWIGQCFWNYLDWVEITHYLSICLLLGCDYQVYFCVAIMKFLEKQILHHHQQQDLVIYLKEEPIRGFRASDYLTFMQRLEKKYRTIILAEMLTFTKS